MQTFRILSALLSYPEPDLLAALPALRAAMDEEALLPHPAAVELGGFIDELARLDMLDAQERYVALFDRNRSLSLHIYEHVHGESRERGQAMVRLAELYRLHGLHISARELPDYLPLFLEFLSILPERAARSLLADAVHVMAALREKLARRGSPYAAVLRAVETLAARPAAAHMVAETVAALGADADTLAALDRQWEDEAVRFVAAGGPDGAADAAACGGA
ncbi:MAG: nitrate reductase molybdenum cofactor assembly chaperone [Acetobacteraceae bacterium SCN 69-10]|nr:nitrate reductase molybdenum cofactor assembly chaperone [Rhodospirillales bacterium]ODU62424.1 MAG: nitrate reductase molybdenum cofactor assembly chaperone [Acetobacteraceae bacterium SCN 69-10]OJY70214.1 MAG: nitrate reductase molybdenum cofactor assembly chaperone [Rhodospirillales bacterium 70-18]